MSPDLVEDVIQEIWLVLATREPDEFNHAVESPAAYITSFVRDAVKRVRAGYCAPGTRTRSRDGLRAVGSDYRAIITAAHDPLWERTIAGIDARIDIERAARKATPPVSRAIMHIRDVGASIDQAAAYSGIPRSTLQRRLRQLGTAVTIDQPVTTTTPIAETAA
jgi:DNA-directed RNA polymerase specialized sigma24 family protein